MENNETKILHVDAYDGDCFGVTLSSGHTILLELSDRIREPSFAALIERGVFDKPQTDGKRVFWQDGPAFTVTEILAMVAQGGAKSQASMNQTREASTAMEKKKARILTICGAVAATLSAVFIVIGILDAAARSDYQNLGINTPVVVILDLVFIAGVAAFIVGLKKMKSAR